jgi:hypothetical protein
MSSSKPRTSNEPTSVSTCGIAAQRVSGRTERRLSRSNRSYES